ncbi:MAG TPA: hypothetical protein VF551_02410, partial [Chthoniobacterales bacterium]
MTGLSGKVQTLLDLPLIARARAVTGVDRAVFFTLVGRGWSVVAGPLTLFFVARFLSKEEQGFFYTFSSVVGLHVFFELGLAYVIMQAVSHEKAHLDWTPAGTLVGDANAKARLASILRLALKWYLGVGALVFTALTIAGLLFFEKYEPPGSTIDWRLPWVALVIATGLGLMLTPFYGVLEGCGEIAKIARLGVYKAILGSVVVWGALYTNLRLYAAPALTLISTGLVLCYLLTERRRRFFMDLFRTPIAPGGGVSWRYEILPFQWKISLSWLSGYFIFQLANPVMFRFHGAAEAGRLGMTMRIIDSITVLGAAWVSTKAAPFGSYVAKRDFAALDRVFWKASLQSVAVVTLGAVSFILLYYALAAYQAEFIHRLLGPLATCLLLANAIVSTVIFSQAMYLRAHKEEPFLINSVIGAIMVSAILYFLGRPFGALGISAGLLCGGL